jgi:hypothetical protein
MRESRSKILRWVIDNQIAIRECRPILPRGMYFNGPVADSKANSVRISPTQTLPPMAECDFIRLRALLNKYLKNAALAAPTGEATGSGQGVGL